MRKFSGRGVDDLYQFSVLVLVRVSGLRVKVNVTGIVQGVGFRPFVYRIAVRNALAGYVQNRGDAGVEIILEGTKTAIQSFLRDLTEQKPPQAQIHQITQTPLQGKNQYPNFTIIKSSNQAEHSGSVIPPDIAICNDCLRELRDPHDPRFDYFFITCTNCGPRFTIIERLPYDRENTTMREFPLCGLCTKNTMTPQTGASTPKPSRIPPADPSLPHHIRRNTRQGVGPRAGSRQTPQRRQNRGG
jgi:hydrogenase maturation protein HypF